LLLVMVLISFALSETMFRYMKNREADSLVDIAIMRSLGVSQWRKRAEDLAKQVTSRSRIRQELEKYNLGEIDLQQLASFTKPKLQDAVSLSTEIIDILRLDARGQVVTGCGFESEEFLKNYNVTEFVHKKTTLSEPLTINNRTLIIASAPIINRADEYQGADLVFLDLEHLKKVATNPDKIGKTGLVTVGYKSENSIRPLFSPQSQSTHNSNSFELVKTFLSLAIDGKSGVESIGRIMLIYQSIDSCNWGLVVTQNTDELYLPVYAQMKTIICLSIAIYFIILVGFWLLIKPLAGKILLHTSELERRIQERTEDLEREVAQHKRSETTLQKSEEKFRAMVETSPDGIAITSLDGKVQYVSPQILAMWGYEHESEMIGKSMTDLFRSDYHEKAAQSIGSMFSGKFIGAEEYVMIRKDGSEFFGEANANLIYNEKDEPVSILFIDRDITDRKRSEQRLRVADELRAMEAGRAQAAASVLHNIGNAITPAGIYTEEMLAENRNQTLAYLEKSYDDLLDHRDDLQAYVNRDERGKRVFDYMKSLIASLKQERDRRRDALNQMKRAIERILEMLNLQQAYVETTAEKRREKESG